MNSVDADIAVVGAGPAGLAAACLAAKAGLRTVSIAGAHGPAADPRTVALMQPSIRLLEHLGLWPGDLMELCAPLRRLRLIDDTGSPLPAPSIAFDARDIGLDAFGWNIPLHSLVAALADLAPRLGAASVAADALRLAVGVDSVRLDLADGRAIAARAVIASDGRDSKLRAAAGTAVEASSYDQTAIATSFGHSAAHRDTSSEYHRRAGPFTTVPLPGRRSSLVWMERPERAARLMAMDDARLAAEIQAATHGELGLVSGVGPRRAFALSSLTARCFGRNRVYLVGEAAHAGPPIGAQGLNMSLRDAALAAELAAASPDPGADHVLARYDAERRADVVPRQSLIDLMNRSLLTGFPPLEAGRALGLAALDAFAPLRHFAMQRGLAPLGAPPAAMRG